MNPSAKIGPNVRKLIFQKMAIDAVPAGGGINHAIGFLLDKDKITAGFRSAAAWV